MYRSMLATVLVRPATLCLLIKLLYPSFIPCDMSRMQKHERESTQNFVTVLPAAHARGRLPHDSLVEAAAGHGAAPERVENDVEPFLWKLKHGTNATNIKRDLRP